MTDEIQKELADELWKWTIDRVKKDNVVSKSPTEYDKWVEATLEVSISTDGEGLKDGWFRQNEFHHIWVETIDKLVKQKEDAAEYDDDGNYKNDAEQCAIEFIEKLSTYWHNHKE